jgi:phosphatidylglycerol---prolipoprotein diacylglyceryl transferase
MIPILLFPSFNPDIIRVGPFAIRWYALAYIAGLVAGWQLLRRLVRSTPAVATPVQADDFLTWATLGVVIGGRIGFVLFYQPAFYFSHPSQIFAVWEGGMSFHGGMLGVALATWWFCWKNSIPLLGFADRVAVCVPIGLGLGRVANFINGELWGRTAPEWLPWGMIFPNAEPIPSPPPGLYQKLQGTICANLPPALCVPRHPSQIYEMLLEGAALFCVMFALSRRENIRAKFGYLTGAFLIGYGIARIIGEFFRQPDVYLGYLIGGATMGQLLSIPMVLAGVWLILRTR